MSLLPVDLFHWILALLPIVILLVSMAVFSFPAYQGAFFALIATIIIGLTAYKADFTVIVVESEKAIWNASSIILVVFAAMLIYEVSEESKAFDSIHSILGRLIPNELIKILGVGMVFASFLQGVAGFGVPVAVAAPLLIAMGVKSVRAVMIPLFGHAWAGTFGTLAVAWSSLIQSSGVNNIIALESGLYAGVFLWILNLASGLFICYLYGGAKGIKKALPAVLIFSFIQGGGQLLLTQINVSLATFLPAALALVLLFLISKMPMYKEPWEITGSAIMDRKKNESTVKTQNNHMSLWEAFFPYISMTILTFVLLLDLSRNSKQSQIPIMKRANDSHSQAMPFSFIAVSVT